MIEVENLTKSFGGVRALQSITFRVEPGEILGFLGPNGAGKSTTMRILAGYLPGDSGTVRVGGLDVRLRSLDVRRTLGYLPEAVPLYSEMRVVEYLRFRARLKGIPIFRRRSAIDRSIEHADIRDVRRRVIGTLSRGYRQRVGVADAWLGDPKVLILDEPTVGLDPEQVRQFRQLVRDAGKDRTIILSTHILTEVELVCSSVAIIDRGRLLARGTVESVRRKLGSAERTVAEVAGPPEEVRASLEAEADVLRARVDARRGEAEGKTESSGGKRYHQVVVEPRGGQDLRELVFRVARDRGWTLRELRREVVPLEDVFVDILRAEEHRGGS